MQTYVSTAAVTSVLLILFFTGMPVHAADSQLQKGGAGGYGEKQEITTAGDARKALKKYFAGRDVIIGEIVERERYFEAEVMDKKKTVIDTMVIDKRTGRVRSIY